MAYIRKLADKWQAQIERNGKRSSKTFQTKREAQAWAAEQEAKAKRDRHGGGHTFGDAVAEYKARVSVKKAGSANEARRLDVMLGILGADTLLRDIDAPDITRWRDKRLETVSASSVVREANLLRNLFRVARDEWRWMEHYPFQGVRLPAEAAPRQAIWPWRLIKRVLRAPRIGKTAEMQDAFRISLRTGMRLSEVLEAPAGFDPKRRIVRLPQTKTEKDAIVPVGRIAAKVLTRPPFTVGPNEGSVLFSKLCRELLIEGLTFHDARATALTHLARKVDVLTLAKISRHKDVSLLSNVYYRERPEDIAARI